MSYYPVFNINYASLFERGLKLYSCVYVKYSILYFAKMRLKCIFRKDSAWIYSTVKKCALQGLIYNRPGLCKVMDWHLINGNILYEPMVTSFKCTIMRLHAFLSSTTLFLAITRSQSFFISLLDPIRTATLNTIASQVKGVIDVQLHAIYTNHSGWLHHHCHSKKLRKT